MNQAKLVSNLTSSTTSVAEAAGNVIDRTELLVLYSSSHEIRLAARALQAQVERLRDFAQSAADRGTKQGYLLADLHQFFILAKRAFDRMIGLCRDSDAAEWRAVIARRNIEDSFQKLREIVLPS